MQFIAELMQFTAQRAAPRSAQERERPELPVAALVVRGRRPGADRGGAGPGPCN